MKRILIIANKAWEVEPALNAMLNGRFQPDSKKPFFPSSLISPWQRQYGESPEPRAIYEFSNICVEVWCIQDHMDPSKSLSSSEEKNRIMPAFFSYKPEEPDLVIAFGTASSAPGTSCNGSVVVGSNVFIHDGHPADDPNPDSQFRSDKFGKLLTSNIEDGLFCKLLDSVGEHISKMLTVPVMPSTPVLESKSDYIAVSTVNVTNYKEYEEKDAETIQTLKDLGIKEPIGSVETTHGVIRVQSDAPFMFVSGIPNRFAKFGEDMDSQPEAQNYAAGFNAGIVAAYLLPVLNEWYK